MSNGNSYGAEWGWFFSSFKKPAIESVEEVSRRSLNVAIVLSLFLGWTGIDRYYLGKIGTGILKMITFGGLGIWWIIDLYILVGSKTPKDIGGVPLKDSETKASFTYLFLTVFANGFGLHYLYLGFTRLAFTRLGLSVLYLILFWSGITSGRGYYHTPNPVLVFLTMAVLLILLLWAVIDIYLAITGKVATDAAGNPLTAGEPKYQSICLILALVGGFVGFDRFYLGHRVLGILKLFTLGGLFMWYFLDIVLAVLNVHKDSRGEPLLQE